MELEPNMPQIDSKFRLVLLAAKRAEQLMRGARPKVEGDKQKPTRLAMQEVHSDMVTWDYGPAPQPEPPAAEEQEGAETAGEVH
jgi:DNA-directed RNA polymerase subunit omega